MVKTVWGGEVRRGEEEEKLLLGGTQLRFIINFHQATDLTGTREGRKGDHRIKPDFIAHAKFL